MRKLNDLHGRPMVNIGHAFRWDRRHGLMDLGTLGGDFSSAHAINNAGLAVGGSYMSDNLQADAV